MSYLFTSESVSCGHPDKIADQISDAILDEALKRDPLSRVAIETLVTKGQVVIAGEMTTNAFVDIDNCARDVIKEIGYNKGELGFDYHSCGILTAINKQSPDIAMGVDKINRENQGAGDQGMMFGYATNESDEYMPLTLVIAREIINSLTFKRLHMGWKDNLLPDAKAQVTIEYSDDNKPIRVDTVLVSQQHVADTPISDLYTLIQSIMTNEIIPSYGHKISFNGYKLIVNPTGRFVIGGPAGDTGLTGRKIIVDTYGGACPHGGGAFSGKDPSKVDRSAAYMCRYVAKNLVASGIADRVCLQVSYAIGMKQPVSIMVNTYGTTKFGITDKKIADRIPKLFDFTPYGIIKTLGLYDPIYKLTARYGHFGITPPGFQPYKWERTDMVDDILAVFVEKAK